MAALAAISFFKDASLVFRYCSLWICSKLTSFGFEPEAAAHSSGLLGPVFPILLAAFFCCCSAFSSSASCFWADSVAFFKASSCSSMAAAVVTGGLACCKVFHCLACLCSLLLPVVVPDPAGLFLLFTSSILFQGLGANKKQLFQAKGTRKSFFKDLWHKHY